MLWSICRFRRSVDPVRCLALVVRVYVPGELSRELPVLKQWRWRSVWEPLVVSRKHGTTPLVGHGHRRELQVQGRNSHEGGSCCSHGCESGWTWSPLPVCWPLNGVALAALIYSVCLAVQLLCALVLVCRGFFDIGRPGVITQMKDLDECLGLVVRGLCGVLPSHLRLNMF